MRSQLTVDVCSLPHRGHSEELQQYITCGLHACNTDLVYNNDTNNDLYMLITIMIILILNLC